MTVDLGRKWHWIIRHYNVFLRTSISFPMLIVPLKIECTSTRYWKINILSSSSFKKNHCTFPRGIRRNNNAIMTSTRRRVDVIITLFLRQVSTELLLMSLLPEWLTHWGQGKMDTISQTIFSNAFSWMKMFQLRLKFHWSLFPRVQSTIFQHWVR